MHSGNTSRGDDLTSGRGILAHEMDSKLGAIDNGLVVDVGTVGVGSWRDSGLISSTYPSQRSTTNILVLSSVVQNID